MIKNEIDKKHYKDINAFNELFENYYILLCTIAHYYLKNKHLAEEIVEEVFLHFWEKKDDIQISTSIKAYLVKAVQNCCLNFIEHQQVEQKHKNRIETENAMSGIAESYENPLGFLYEKELTLLIKKSIQSLPDQCQKIFLLSRDEGLTYEEISLQLNISINTTKTQIKIALAKLRTLLKDYLPTIIVAITLSILNN